MGLNEFEALELFNPKKQATDDQLTRLTWSGSDPTTPSRSTHNSTVGASLAQNSIPNNLIIGE